MEWDSQQSQKTRQLIQEEEYEVFTLIVRLKWRTEKSRRCQNQSPTADNVAPTQKQIHKC
jgi:hypothetical protein